jgi:hypothetical protein
LSIPSFTFCPNNTGHVCSSSQPNFPSTCGTCSVASTSNCIVSGVFALDGYCMWGGNALPVAVLPTAGDQLRSKRFLACCLSHNQKSWVVYEWLRRTFTICAAANKTEAHLVKVADQCKLILRWIFPVVGSQTVHPNSTRLCSQLSNHVEMFMWFVHLMRLSLMLCDMHLLMMILA